MRNVHTLRKAGWALLMGQMLFPVYIAALSLALTCCHPVGEKSISIGFGPEQAKVFMIGLAILLTSWIFQEGAMLQEEQRGVV